MRTITQNIIEEAKYTWGNIIGNSYRIVSHKRDKWKYTLKGEFNDDAFLIEGEYYGSDAVYEEIKISVKNSIGEGSRKLKGD